LTSRAAASDRDDTLSHLRRNLLRVLLLGITGVSVELLLIGHVEPIGQLIPIVLLAAGFAAVIWHMVSGNRPSLLVLRTLMACYAIAGVLGIGLHLKGNVEFELEMYPTLAGRELVAKTLTGATPALAPGTMVLLGLVGGLYTYRHPSSLPRHQTLSDRRPAP
jgi:multisubunit Na+/H+ antiporter MnhB subunit